MAVVGLKVCTPDGRRPGFIRAMLRAWIGLFGILIWFVTGVGVFFDTKRRTLLDRLAHTEVRYSVPENQQRRHIRDAIEELRGQAGKMARQEERDRANAQALLELGEQPASGPAGAPAPMGDLDGSRRDRPGSCPSSRWTRWGCTRTAAHAGTLRGSVD